MCFQGIKIILAFFGLHLHLRCAEGSCADGVGHGAVSVQKSEGERSVRWRGASSSLNEAALGKSSSGRHSGWSISSSGASVVKVLVPGHRHRAEWSGGRVGFPPYSPMLRVWLFVLAAAAVPGGKTSKPVSVASWRLYTLIPSNKYLSA